MIIKYCKKGGSKIIKNVVSSLMLIIILAGCFNNTGSNNDSGDGSNDPEFSSNADLSSITLNEGSLTPGFNPAEYTYTMTVNHDVGSLNVNATACDSSARVSIDPGSTVDLVQGDNNILIKVTAQNGTEKVYTIVVTKLADPDATFTITYFSNGAGSGSVPVDNSLYSNDDEVTVEENTGRLSKTDKTWVGWNTKADGSGEVWIPGTKITVSGSDLNLYANWIDKFTGARPDFELKAFTDGVDDDGNTIIRRYKILRPWNEDTAKKYPIVISLHGSSQSDKSFYTDSLVYWKDINQQAYPCYVIAPNSDALDYGWAEDGAWIRKLLEDFIANNDNNTYISNIYPEPGDDLGISTSPVTDMNFNIDTDRIYIVGFSMGGSGSFQFAQLYWQDYGRIPAGILRISGVSWPTGWPLHIADEIMERCSVWHFFEHPVDSDAPYNAAMAAYSNAKALAANNGAIETTDTMFYLWNNINFECRNTTLTLNGLEIYKMSEVLDIRHSDLQVIHRMNPMAHRWLFMQNLQNRL